MITRKRKGASQDAPLRHNNRNNSAEPELVCWSYAPGICRFQAASAKIARKLSQRRGARLVMWSVQGPYMRVFEERIEPWRARDLVKRYLTPTNGAFLSPISSPAHRKSAAVSNTAGDRP